MSLGAVAVGFQTTMGWSTGLAFAAAHTQPEAVAEVAVNLHQNWTTVTCLGEGEGLEDCHGKEKVSLHIQDTVEMTELAEAAVYG